jgi:excinuclease ABC subunit B
MTRSMEKAIGETERRRNKQVAHNLAHGITPESVVRPIADYMEGARDAGGDEAVPPAKRGPRQMFRIAEEKVDYAVLDPQKLAAAIRKLEAQMYKHAQNLEFEEAAKVRDEIRRAREQGLMR